MIEPSRRHGPFDPRFSIERAGPDRPAATGMTEIEEVPSGLDWAAFSGRFFRDRRRHDFEVLKAYEAYRNGSYGLTDEPARDRETALVLVATG